MSGMTRRGRALWRVGWALGILIVVGALLLIHYTIFAFWDMDAQETASADSDAPGRFVEVDGRQLHLIVLGDLGGDPTGAPLVMLHGFSVAGAETWFPWAQALAEQRTVILPDMLNFGRSERVTSPSPELTHRGQARLLAGALAALGVERFDLVGRSYGGAVASQYILDYPGHVRRVIYMDAQVYPNRLASFFSALGALPLGVGRAITWHTLGGAADASPARHCKSVGEELCAWLHVARIKGTVAGLQAINATPQETRIPADLGQIDVPALVIWGSEDPEVPLDDGKRLAAEVRALRLEIIPGAGHWPFLTDPEGVKRLVLEFCAGS